jgi:bis(5'-nucleosyl)-tetraphosphatase (symmetrical)
MSTYAIGDLQGCFLTLKALLDVIKFDRARDRLWFVGDLVNRGTGSLECLRFAKKLGDRAVTVLGNHDLHLLAVAEGAANIRDNDTLADILNAPDRDALLTWLRKQPLLHIEGAFAMVHAGLHPAWTWETAKSIAADVSEALLRKDYKNLLSNMYGNEPDQWRDDLKGFARLRFAINTFTRMRALTDDQRLQLKYKGTREDMPKNLRAWFDVASVRGKETPIERTIIAGHWSALGLHVTPAFVGLDAGCVWGRELATMRLEDRKIFRVLCVEKTLPTGWD